MLDPLAQMKQDQARTSRGRLKVYLGMAAGVGKTYGMLVEANQAIERGEEVVIGYLEPHGRVETENLAIGMERIPLRQIEHRGVVLMDFDLDAALARHPRTILVDELAHTNLTGARHAKRWQDVEELLRAQIDVITTINIQHIESLRDVVAQITGVFVQETVPDAFFEQADEIELVDIPPEQLHQRLRDGKVYGQEKVAQALDGFFKRSNLLALRELALRHTAEQVDKALRVARGVSTKQETWHAGERVLVCIAPNRMAPRVVRAAKRLAASLHAEMIAATVESSRQRTATGANRDYQEHALLLSESLGAKTVTLAGDDIVAELISFARRENVTTIVMGKPVRPRWKEVLFGSVVDATIRASGDIDVLVITGAETSGTPLFRRPTVGKARWQGYIESCLVIGLCTLIGTLVIDSLQVSNVMMLYLVGVVAVSLRNGVRESMLAAILSVVALNYFFVEPRFTFSVGDARYLVTFAVMLAVSVILSGLTLRLRESSRAMSERERRTAALYDLSRRLAESRKKEEMTQLAGHKATELLNCPSAVLIREDNKLRVVHASASQFEQAPNEFAVAGWVMDHGLAAGATTETLSGASGIYVPLNGSLGTVGVLALDVSLIAPLDTAQRHLIEAIANQLAGALERAQFAKDSHLAALQAEAEQMRSDLLSAVSHDLRTPLASIEGSATSLIGQPDMTPTGVELARTIQDESRRMARLVQNLLDMTRVQGAVALNLDWHSLDDLVANAIERTQSLFELSIQVTAPAAQVLVRADGVLLEQVLVNLLENAARYAGAGAKVQVGIVATGAVTSLTIADNGPGFADGDEERIFDRFHRTSGAGFGLGLAICRAAVEAHRGTITAKNLNPGALFCIDLPVEMPLTP